MKRRMEITMGIIFVTLPLLFLMFAVCFNIFFILGSLFFSFLLPIGYKLIKYPNKREITVEEVVKIANKQYSPLFLSFSGIDGSGKSTHAKAIKKRLEKNGIPCKIVWARWRPIVTYPFMGIVYVLKKYRRKDYYKNRMLRKIWAYLTIFDFIYLFLFKIKPHLTEGKVIICDRYIYDHIAQLMYDKLYNERAVRIMLKLIPNPSLSFIFDVPEQVASYRKRDTQEMLKIWKFEDDAEKYLREMRKNYLKIADSMNIPIVDATKDFKELHEEIYRHVFKAYMLCQKINKK